MDLTPSTPQTSSGSSNDLASNLPDQELDAGSECGWRDTDQGPRPIFYMSDEEATKYSAISGLYKDGQKIRVGICAMAKKTNSKPMKEILARLGRFETLQVQIFEESVILNEPVQAWPVVDALISFFSFGFPLQKAIQYKNLHKPFVVNDLEAQYAIKDRREVYKILVREGISHPRYAVLNRDGEEKGEFEDTEDAIDVNGTQFQRPFVEKPVDAEDHNIYIYFPVSAGGGCQKLFRKVGSRSSVYSTTNRVRKTGSFIYEDFMPTDGTDVKVYTVGPDYAHAEARKSPALDGKVERDKEGKEVRYPVLLSATEKMIARKVCLAFKQNVCGFDLLRTGGKSYVCDVNGFSFVKNSTKYYDDCANVLGTMIIRALAPQLHIPLILGAAPEDIPVVPTTSGSMMELRCVIAVIRHGDRTPKQKMKMEVKHKKFFDLFEKYNGYKKGHLKLKKPKQLQEVLDIARDLLSESHHDTNAEVQEKKAKLHQLKLVLEMYGHFSGINRKVQLKYQPNGAPKKSSSEEDEFPKESSLVLIVKWGGELTPAGKYQAEDLGKAFRTLYPGGEFDTPGLGFLRLHSTFRHDLKIYASDEGRVQMTAAAFTKGLLALEGELTPILVSMVKSANTNGLLDKEGETSKFQHIVKEKLMQILNQDWDFNEEDIERLSPTGISSLLQAMDYVKNPKRLCDQIHDMVCQITSRIKALKMELKSRDLKLYHGESWELLIRRWSKLEKDFKLKSGSYNISKIPDIYDCIKYDLQHNHKTLQYARSNELFLYSKALADIVIPQEYGITVEEKVHISQSICTPLMRKIHSDLVQAIQQPSDEHSTRLNSKYSKGVTTPERFVRTRLYFTSESHIHSLLNMLRYGGLCDEEKDEQWKKAMNFLSSTPELNYMTQINIMMFEDSTKEPSSPERFHIELHFSPGAYTCSDKNVVNPASSGYRTSFLVKQADKLKDPTTKDVKVDSCPSLLKDIINKDGLITEEISEETSDDTVSGNNSIVVTNSAKKPVTLNESGSQNFFKDVCDTEGGDSNSGAKLSSFGSKEHCIVTNVKEKDVNQENKVTEEVDALKKEIVRTSESLPSTKDNICRIEIDDSNAKGKCVESEETMNSEANDDTITEGSNEFLIEKPTKQPVDSMSDILDTKDPSKDSSTSSVYLTAEEPDEDDKPAAEQSNTAIAGKLDNIIEDKLTANKPDIGPSLNKADDCKRENVVNELDIKAESNIGKNATKSDANELCGAVKADDIALGIIETEKIDTKKTDVSSDIIKKGFDVRNKSSIKLPDTLNVQAFGSIQKEDAHGKEAKKHKFEHELLFPVGIKRVPEPKSPDPNIPAWDWDDDKDKNKVPEPQSPDPDIPEWDWDDDKGKDSDNQMNTVGMIQRPKSAGTVVSLPITITPSGSSAGRGGDGKKGYEETRSHSLEENDSKEGGLALLEKHYRTIHLPINNSSHHSFSSLLYLNPDAFKDPNTLCLPHLPMQDSYSAPDLSGPSDYAFDGFNMVPSLKPLETLHNNLTMLDLDGFLCRCTTTKFFTPDSSNVTTPLPSPRCPELNRTKSSGPSLPSSSNSSAGPSSPTNASTPDDFLNRLKMYIMDSVKMDQGPIDPEADVSSESSMGSTSLKQESNQATIVPQKKPSLVPETYTLSPNASGGLNMAAGHVSAFKAVSRSSSQKTQFIVTHVPEDRLMVKKAEKSEADEKKD